MSAKHRGTGRLVPRSGWTKSRVAVPAGWDDNHSAGWAYQTSNMISTRDARCRTQLDGHLLNSERTSERAKGKAAQCGGRGSMVKPALACVNVFVGRESRIVDGPSQTPDGGRMAPFSPSRGARPPLCRFIPELPSAAGKRVH
jgi:hypothetical protein